MRLVTRGLVPRAEQKAALALADAATAYDGFAPLSEQVRLQFSYGGDASAATFLCWDGDQLAGLAQLGSALQDGTRSGELVVHPACRRRGFGRALAQAVLAEAGPAPVRIWAHGDLPAAAGLAAAVGFARMRDLWQMRAELPSEPPAPRLPPGVELRAFALGRDEEAWVALNARAFASHPEQGQWTRADLTRREREPWFDPAGFLLAERGGQLVGFHWTKVHPAVAGAGPEAVSDAAAGETATGEVYVVGVNPSEQGNGLGRALTLAGLRFLHARGIHRVMLYVDASNAPAIRLYTGLGFAHTTTDVMYEHVSA